MMADFVGLPDHPEPQESAMDEELRERHRAVMRAMRPPARP
jgi:hypothetical protein